MNNDYEIIAGNKVDNQNINIIAGNKVDNNLYFTSISYFIFL